MINMNYDMDSETENESLKNLNPENQNNFFDFPINNPLFICVISHTDTSEISGLTIAGANPDMIKYTPPADAEFLYYGKCKCIEGIPASPDGKPTPALITRSMLQNFKIPFMVVNSGAKINPSIPYFSFNISHGKNIQNFDALSLSETKRAYQYGKILGNQLSKTNDFVVIGESIPGGTTTALGVMLSMGIDAYNKVSSSMPDNPNLLKKTIIENSMEKKNILFGSLKHDPFKAISLLGDPMIPSVAGISSGLIENEKKIMLAGGTQMCSVAAILKSLNYDMKKISIGTTSYVVKDPSSDFVGLASLISHDISIYGSKLDLEHSKKEGLRAYSKGYVKEGVGAGGVSILAMLISKRNITSNMLLSYIEKEYEYSIERYL